MSDYAAPIGRAPAGEQQLRRQAVPQLGVLAQSVAQIAPSAAAATGVALIASSAGNGAWVTWAICTVALLLVAYGIVRLSRRFATTGGVVGLAAKSWGPIGGILAGGGLAIVNGIAAGPALTIGFAIYFNSFLGQLGVHNSAGLFYVLLILNLVVAAWFAYQDIRVSAQILLLMEAVTMALILVIMLVVLGKHASSLFDAHQLQLQGVSLHGIFLGLVLAVYSFGGFESATALGQEAKNPRRSIPIAVVASVIIVGVFFIFNSYVQPLGFQGSKLTITTSQAPLNDLASLAGVPFFQYLINLGVSASMFSCTLAIFNSTCRQWFTLAREGFLPSPIARSHPRHRTPFVAIASLGVIWFVVLTVVSIVQAKPLDMYGYLGTMAGYSFLLAYFAVTIGAMVYFARQRQLTIVSGGVGVIAAALLLAVFVNSVYPVPAFPFNVINFTFLGFLAVLLVGYALLRVRFPQKLEQLGRTVSEDTALAAEEPAPEVAPEVVPAQAT